MNMKNTVSNSLWAIGLTLILASIVIGYIGFSHTISEGDAGPANGPTASRAAGEFENLSVPIVVLEILGILLMQGSVWRFSAFRV